MKCPYCEHDFPLTWKRYLTSPFGSHRCPQCSRKSRLRWTWRYILVTCACGLLGIGSLAVIGMFLFTYESGLVAGLVLLILVGIPVDKYYDTHCRVLVGSPSSDGGTERGRDDDAEEGRITCSICQKSHNPNDVVQIGDLSYCVSCKPIAIQMLKEGLADVTKSAVRKRHKKDVGQKGEKTDQ